MKATTTKNYHRDTETRSKAIKYFPVPSVPLCYKISFLFITLFFIFTFSSIADETPSNAGIVTYVKGIAQKKGTTGEEWERARENTNLASGDKFKTLEKTRAEIRLEAGKVIRLDENTTVDLVKLVEESQGKVETDIKMEQGNLWAKVGKLGEKTEFKVESPIAGASIRGTTFRVGVALDGSTQLNVYEGAVEVYNPMQRAKEPITRIEAPREVAKPGYVEGPKEVTLDEWSYIVRNMQKFTITTAGVRKIESFRKNDTDEQSDWVKWNMERDKNMERTGKK